ncbi:hypothetical protein BU17DRAFT_92316 [Hysterangium stoloniferum]|nr:hypothetical protein BU17DRAFT_92316 [Hysterangium stoloniferum]
MSWLISDDSRMPLGVSPGGYLFLASDSDPWDDDPRMSPSWHPRDRFSMGSDSGLSVHSITSGSKCPTEKFNTGRKGTFLAYVYDPSQDQNGPPDADDIMHGPETLDHDKGFQLSISGAVLTSPSSYFSYHTHLSFHIYPIITFLRLNIRNLATDNNVQVNGTGQVPVLTNFLNDRPARISRPAGQSFPPCT